MVEINKLWRRSFNQLCSESPFWHSNNRFICSLIVSLIISETISAAAFVNLPGQLRFSLSTSRQKTTDIVYQNSNTNALEDNAELQQQSTRVALALGILQNIEINGELNYQSVNSNEGIIKSSQGLSDFGVGFKKMSDFAPYYAAISAAYLGPASSYNASSRNPDSGKSGSYIIGVTGTHLKKSDFLHLTNLDYFYLLRSGQGNYNQHRFSLSHYLDFNSVGLGVFLGSLVNEGGYDYSSNDYLQWYLSDKPWGSIDERYYFGGVSLYYKNKNDVFLLNYSKKLPYQIKNALPSYSIEVGYNFNFFVY
ncbi:MAG: hypothetical protein KBD78_01975 [Oligoflexales bacterium]|nr:hypothetical protein [Oligoflexales bacterium]